MYIYIMNRDSEDRIYKIGSTQYPHSRILSLNTSSSNIKTDLRYIKIFKFSNISRDELFSIEFMIHNLLDDFRLLKNREFFNLDNVDIVEKYISHLNYSITVLDDIPYDNVDISDEDKARKITLNSTEILYRDQEELVQKTLRYFKQCDKGIWNIFCRYGKTLLSCSFAKKRHV